MEATVIVIIAGTSNPCCVPFAAPCLHLVPTRLLLQLQPRQLVLMMEAGRRLGLAVDAAAARPAKSGPSLCPPMCCHYSVVQLPTRSRMAAQVPLTASCHDSSTQPSFAACTCPQRFVLDDAIAAETYSRLRIDPPHAHAPTSGK